MFHNKNCQDNPTSIFFESFLSVQEYPKKNSLFEMLATRILMNRNLQKMLLTLNHLGCRIGDSTKTEV